MSDYLVKAIGRAKNLRLITVSAKGLVSETQKGYDTWSASSAVLGKTLIGGLLLSAALSKDKNELTVKLLGNGSVGATVVTTRAGLTAKGYVQNPYIALPPRKDRHTDIVKTIGEGWLEVTKNQGLKGPYTGQVPVVGGEIAEDLTYYLVKSEQILSAVGLSVFVEPNNSIGAAGGFVLQVLPGATDEQLTQVEKGTKTPPNLLTLFPDGMSPEDLTERILGTDCKISAKENAAFSCDCSKEKYSKILATLKPGQLKEITEKDHSVESVCRFCKEKYHFIEDELRDVLKKAN